MRTFVRRFALPVVVVLSAVVLAGSGIVACYFWWLPKTSQGWFTHDTGLIFPPDAEVVEDSRDYSVGMVESFASEGTSVFAFKTDRATLDGWVQGKPPWQEQWNRGPVPLWVNKKRPCGEDLYLTQRGDKGNGEMLAIDPDTVTAWLFKWDW